MSETELPAGSIPSRDSDPRFSVDTFIAEPGNPDRGEVRDLDVVRGAVGIGVGQYWWEFAEAERLATAMLAAVRAGREWQAEYNRRRAWEHAARVRHGQVPS